jgi:hypothetical protein
MKKRKNFLAVALLACVGTMSANVLAANCQAAVKSGAKTASIVELYTSEGCDSCPPADKWFSTLRAQPGAAAPIVPLAFHVDYWDYIGWKDRFAQARFAERQRATVGLHGSRTVYTPQIMLDGRDSRTWTSGSRFDASLREVTARAPRAAIALESALTANQVDLSIELNGLNEADRRDAQIYIAITENNLTSRVTAGENRGVTLKHDHVVRELIGPLSTAAAVSPQIKRSVRLGNDWKKEDLAVAVFAQHPRDGSTLQAVSVSLCQK